MRRAFGVVLAAVGLGLTARLVLAAHGMIAAGLASAALASGMLGLALLSRHDEVPARLGAPIMFGSIVIWIWEMLVVGLHVPFVLLPPPSAVALALWTNMATLAVDFDQTYLHSVLAGYAIGSGGGFLLALALDRSVFLQRGMVPFANMMSAIPVVGIAPIMVMWFGFDWPSKAAVVALMTLFPMLVNTQAGLTAAGVMERDLMRSYAAGYWQVLLKLRLPAAMPMIFNALKLNSTLALIGAVVAEFFGTPIKGMGFRISTESARMNLDIVWATITVAALVGSISFGLIAALERGVTFWHPSFHRRIL